jgi:flagellar hook-associated protein 2
MGGISTGTGIFSGIDTASLIEQLLAADSGPKTLAQRRVIQLQGLQAAYLDLNSKLGAMKTAAANLRTQNIFQSNKAASTDDDVLSATASTSATPGSYAFIVDRLVSTQQFLSRGFASAASGGLNAGTFTFESAQARLDRDTNLADLNGGAGISRGKIVVSDAAGHSATIDLSKAATVNDVVDALNSAGGGLNLSARVQGGKFVITSGANSNLTIASAFGYTTAASLGIEASGTGTTVTGTTVYSLGENTAVRALNDGNGIYLNSQTGQARYDFTINVGGTAVNINIGDVYDAQSAVTESAPSTLGGVLERINDQLAAALGNEDVQASVAADGVSIEIVDSQGRTIEVSENTVAGSNTARDLGILTSSPATGTVAGKRILAGLNSTLASSLNGGSGIGGDGQIFITGRDGVARSVTIDTAGSVNDILAAINTAGGANYKASLNTKGTGITITDTTGGNQNLIISGDTADSLGISTDPAGVESSTVVGTNLQHQYMTQGTLLSSLRGGQGVGQGEFRIVDSTGATANVVINEDEKTLDDVMRVINSRGIRVKARINGQGDGIELYEEATGAGTLKIKVEDVSGTVATSLNLKGEAAGTGVQNVINGTFERSVTLAATDTLQQIATKINTAGVGVQAAVITDGSGSTPFRLSLTAKTTGTAGRFIVDTGDFDLGESQLDAGNDAKVFYGSSDPAKGVLLTSSKNTLDNVIQGVSIDLKSVSSDPVTLSITRDTAAIETGIDTFVKTFNDMIGRIDTQTKYDADTNTKGTLLGDSTTELLRQNLYRTIQGDAQGVTSQFSSLLDIGFKVGTGGELTVNKDKLRAALEQDPQGVADLFTARVLKASEPGIVNGDPNITSSNPNAAQEFTSLGVIAQMEELANRYLNTVDGTLTKRAQTVKDQIDFQTKRIADFNAQLETKRQILQQQFLAMEQAIGRLQSQSSALAGLGG